MTNCTNTLAANRETFNALIKTSMRIQWQISICAGGRNTLKKIIHMTMKKKKNSNLPTVQLQVLPMPQYNGELGQPIAVIFMQNIAQGML